MRQGLLLAVMVLAACGVPDPKGTESIESELLVHGKIIDPVDARDCRSFSVRPDAMGTVVAAPQVGMLSVTPATVESMYRNTQALGSETRDGIVEMLVPQLAGHVARASLRFNDVHGWQLAAVPADLHQVLLYTNADGVVTTDDDVREGTAFATLETDLNEQPASHTFDVTSMVQPGGKLGLRIQLVRALGGSLSGTYGSSFDGFALDVTLCNGSTAGSVSSLGRPL